jgi:FKBP-type peptidyl-prolyl cis-trans isomerase FkpA
MKVIDVLAVIILGVFIFSCGQEVKYTDHESGLKYKYFVHDENAEKPKKGDILEMSMVFKTENDSIIEASDFFRMQLTDPTHPGGSVEDAMGLLHVNDSARFIIDAYNFYVRTKKMQLPDFIKPGDKLVFDLKLLSYKKFEDFEQERRSILSTNAAEEENLLKTYLKRMNIGEEPTNSGMYIITLREGDGPKPQPGKKVKVHYYGYFIDGKPFDNSYDRGKPFEFTLGVGQVIPGWDEGISTLKIGEKAKLIIPSYLAYGEEQRGPIPPFSTLIFEVELIDIEK